MGRLWDFASPRPAPVLEYLLRRRPCWTVRPITGPSMPMWSSRFIQGFWRALADLVLGSRLKTGPSWCRPDREWIPSFFSAFDSRSYVERTHQSDDAAKRSETKNKPFRHKVVQNYRRHHDRRD